jgi:bifunctional non-homologous end joining protein LigD
MKGICFSCTVLRRVKGTAKPKERTMRTERAELYFQQGSSDKVYHLQLENVQEAWTVRAQWGRRGAALQNDVKADGVPFEEAKRVYDRILREKTGKGYQIAQTSTNGDVPISVGVAEGKVPSGHTPELLTPIEEPQALRLAEDVSWWFQQKFDGRRLAVQKADGKYSGINKLGQIIPIDSRLTESLDHVQVKGFLADGEITDTHFLYGTCSARMIRTFVSNPTKSATYI